MAESLASLLRVTLLVIAMSCVSAKRFSIMAPNVFHIGVTEQVSISVFDAAIPVTVKLYLQDYPHRRKAFSQVEGHVAQGSNLFLPVKVEAADLPDTTFVDKQFVYLVAKSKDAHFSFRKEAKILLSYKDGMVFIQTDKPIYTPRQSVKIRVIPLEFDMKPSKRKITLAVLNPQGIKVEQWKDLDTSTGIISKRHDLDDFTLMGNWTITAFYGHQDIHNTSVQFEVKEYVLPKFSVKLTVPQYILKSDNVITIIITTRYTHRKPVVGTAVVSLSLAGRDGSIVPFAKHNIMLETSGVTTLSQRIQIIQELPGDYWFPEKGRLQVEADVTERATGNKESAVDKSCQFTSSPYLIEFKNTPKYFKPGLRYVVKVVVTYPNKQPAGDVPLLISAKGKEGDQETELTKFDREFNVQSMTDEVGKAEFVIDACSKCQAITIQVKTDNNRLEESQNAVANYLVKPFNAENGSLILVRQLTPGKVGRKIQCESYRNSDSDDAVRLSFAVVSRGRILFHNTTDPFDGRFKSWSFRVSPQMSPSARLIGYYIDNNERIVADSILLNIEDSLPTKVDFPDAYVDGDGSRVQLNKVKKIPGEQYTLKIKTSPGTRLGLMGVEQSVYLLRDDNRLTKERIFKAAEKLDLGCGAGGGKDNKDVFKNAGVVLMTNNFVSYDNGREENGCSEENSRKKRSVQIDILEDKICCDMGKDNGNVTCGKLSFDSNRQLSRRCRLKFWQCCKALHGMKDTALLGRSGMDNGDFSQDSVEKFLDETQGRSYFPETWIYDEIVVGQDGLVRMDVTIPDTITTWVMQAVAINNQTGLGLATPLRIVGFKDHHISLKLPYSVKRGEQVSLLATVFNYHPEKTRVKLYIKGDKDFCSTAANGERALFGMVKVPPNDARSVAVPIVPKRTGEIFLEVSSIFEVKDYTTYLSSARDTVIKKLFVVPEGKEHRRSQSFILDPNGNLNDGPVDGEITTDKQTELRFNSTRNWRPNEQLQLDIIDLNFNDRVKAIPESVRAVVRLTGNLLGAVIDTTILGGLEDKFQLPSGCGEQTMVKLAPNVYVLEYLMKTNQITNASKEKAYRFIQHGYRRALTYRLTDMSFSIWGSKKPGSGGTWLTAFVMRVFCHAQQFSGVNIDETVVCRSVDWLIQNQRADGALPEVRSVQMRSYLEGGTYNEGAVTMTAFVLSTLAECSCKGVNSETAILNATAYLEKQYKTLNRPYSMALTAYALALVNSTEKLKANDRLVQNAIYDSVKKTRHWNADRNALNVETAAYALLTQVILGRITYAGPIVTYLTNQKRGGVRFFSSQDTVVTLQALSLYSEKTAGKALDLRVKLTSEVKAGWKPPAIHISPENALLRRQTDVKRFLGGKLFVETRGTGVGLLEVEVQYNLPTSRDEICKFDLKTTVKEIKDKPGKLFGPMQNDAAEGKGDNKRPVKRKKAGNKKKEAKGRRRCQGKKKNNRRCRDKGKKPKPPPKHQPVRSIQLKVCTRYRETFHTSMGIMDIGILTGFKPDRTSLKKLRERLAGLLDNVEVSDRSLILYFSEIPNDRELCVDVQFDRKYYVGVVQAVPVKVYDYYEPDESCSVFYGPDKHSSLKLGVCDIGSSSCQCTQDECAQRDPPIVNINDLIEKACNDYHYAIKGKVLLIDEMNTRLAYVVEVVQIIKQGNKDLHVGQIIELWKRGVCHSPDLKENIDSLFMGLDKGDRYKLNERSFVKLWPRSPDDNKDKLILEDFAAQHTC